MEVQQITVEDELDTYYKLIDCDCIDIVRREIGGKYFEIVLDDEGLLKDKPVPSAIDRTGKPMLFGNLFICDTDGYGNLTSLTDKDVQNIMSNLMYAIIDGYMIPIIRMEY